MDRRSFSDHCNGIVQDHGDTMIGVLRRIYGTSFAQGFDQQARLRDLPADALSSHLALLKDYMNGVLTTRIGIARDLLGPQLSPKRVYSSASYRLAP